MTVGMWAELCIELGTVFSFTQLKIIKEPVLAYTQTTHLLEHMSGHCTSAHKECRPCVVHKRHMERQTQGEIPGMSGMKLRQISI